MSPTAATIPEGLDLVATPDSITVRKVWLTMKVVPLAFFAGAWDAFLLFWYAQALSRPNLPLMAIVFPVGHIAVGVALTYYVLASLTNKTDITISNSTVRVTTGPLPWRGNSEVKVEDIANVMVRERISQNRRVSPGYLVMYVDRFQKERRLVSFLLELDQAEYIAQLIRDTLNLPTAKAGGCGSSCST